MNRILEFYTGAKPDDRGRLLREIQQWPDNRLETVHDYIQWLFPLTEPSPVNPTAPVLDCATIAGFQSHEALRASFLRMLVFYGLAFANGKVTKAHNFAQRTNNWLSPGNHNHLRMTRILKSLNLLGLASESRAFYDFLCDLYAERPEDITARTFRFWTDTQNLA